MKCGNFNYQKATRNYQVYKQNAKQQAQQQLGYLRKSSATRRLGKSKFIHVRLLFNTQVSKNKNSRDGDRFW